MSYTSGFFDAVDLGGGDYDREYSAAVFAHYFSLLVKNGVFPDPSTGMQVKASASPDMHVSVQPGNGWVNGYYITVPENGPEVLTVPTANPSLSRIDSVIMGLNYVEREIQLYIKSGAVSASPSAVSLQRDNDLYEMELAQITVAAGVASISQANITDMRQNTSRCGIVKGTIDQIDTTDLFAQYNDAFQTWFADIQAQLSGDVATNLQNQINNLKDGKANASVTDSLQNQVNTLKSDKVNVSDKASTAQAQAGTDNTKWMTPASVKAYADSKLVPTLTDHTTRVSSLETDNTLNKKEIASLVDSLRRQMVSNAYKGIAPPGASAMYVQPFIDTEDINTMTGAFVEGDKLSYNTGKTQGTIDGGTSPYGNSSQIVAIGFKSVCVQTLSSVAVICQSSTAVARTVTFELFSATLTDTNKLTLGSKVTSKSASVSFPKNSDTPVSVSLGMSVEAGYYVLVIKQTGSSNQTFKYYGSRGSIGDLSAGKMIFGDYLGTSYASGTVITIEHQFSGKLVFTSRNVSSASVVSKSISMPYKATKALVYMEVNTVTGITLKLNNTSVTSKSTVNTTTVNGVSCTLWSLEVNISNLNTLLWSLALSGSSAIRIYSLAVFYI